MTDPAHDRLFLRKPKPVKYRNHRWQFWRPRRRILPDTLIPSLWAAALMRNLADRIPIEERFVTRLHCNDARAAEGMTVKIASIGSINPEE